MIFGYLIFVTAMLLSGVAAYYSVTGLTAIFAAAVVPVIVMGSILELGKVVATVWLHVNWYRVPRMFKLYLIPAVAALMLLTSMGIFGFLSKAHLDQAVPTGDVAAQVQIYDDKIQTQRDNITVARKALKQLDDSVDQLMGRSTDERGAERAVQVRRNQNKERQRLQNEIAQAQTEITKLQEARAPMASNLRKVEAEVGPIKYLAALIYDDTTDHTILEKAVRWVILLIVAVFDPLALVLILAGAKQLAWARAERNNTAIATIEDIVPVPVPVPVEANSTPIDDLAQTIQDTEPEFIVDAALVNEQISAINKVEFDVEGIQAEIEQLLQQEHATQEQMADLQDQITSLVTQRDLSNQQASTLTARLAAKSQELDEFVGAADAIGADYVGVVAEFEQAQQVNTDLTEQLDYLQTLYDALALEKVSLLDAYNQELDRATQLTQQIADLEQALVELNAQLIAASSVIDAAPELLATEVPVNLPTHFGMPEFEQPRVQHTEPAVELVSEIAADNVELPETAPNAAFGTKFPLTPNKGDLFLRVDSLPSRLYKWNNSKWIEIDKTITDSYTYDEAYIKFLITKLTSGDYDTDDLSVAEQEQVTEYLKRTRRV